VAVTRFADPSVSNILGWIFIKAFFAVMTESSRRVVSAVNTDPSTVTSRQFKKLHVEHACFCMQVAVASYAFICRRLGSRPPRSIIEKCLALLTVVASSVVLAVTYWLAVTADRTPAGMSITMATSTDCQVRYGVVFVLLLLAD